MALHPDLAKAIPRASLVLLAGGIRSGKSCLAYGILEHCHRAEPARAVYAFNFPIEKAGVLPDWIKPIHTEDFPEGSVILADEAYLAFYAKDHQSDANQYMDVFSGLAGQKDILIVFVTQTMRKLSLAAVSGIQVLLLKRPDLMAVKLDRSELRRLLSDALNAFRRRPEADRRRAVYIIAVDYEGLLAEANSPPEFWTEELSKAWQGVSLVNGGGPAPAEEGVPGFGKVSCIQCFGPATALCGCCKSSWCAPHLAEHQRGESPAWAAAAFP